MQLKTLEEWMTKKTNKVSLRYLGISEENAKYYYENGCEVEELDNHYLVSFHGMPSEQTDKIENIETIIKEWLK